MASFITRLLSRFKTQPRSQRNRRRELGRKLRVENMEARRLMAGDLGSITGNVVTDLTDNGFDGGDTAIVGTNVHLYRDGGNTVFNSNLGTAGGDDVFIGTDVSDGSGNYRFNNLPAGRYFIEQAPATGRLQRPVEQVKTVVIADVTSFDDSLPIASARDFNFCALIG